MIELRGRRLLEHVAFPVTLACAIAGLFLLTNSNIPFANGGNCDTWHFYGRFFLGDRLQELPYTREGSRVPEFIIGYLLEHVFHGIIVEYLNFLILFVSAVSALYYAAKRLFGAFAAAFAAIFFATHPLVIGNYSVTYTEGAATYSAIAMALAIISSNAAHGVRRVAALLFAGVFWGAAIHSHLESLTMNFIVPLYCVDWKRHSPWPYAREVAAKWLLLLAGAVIATVLFGAVNVLVFHGSFYFFLKQFQDVTKVLIVPYQKPNWYLLGGRGAILLVGVAVIVVQAVWAWRRGWAARGTSEVLTVLVPFVVLVAAQVGYTLFDNGLSLEYDYWFVWLLAPLALLLASFAHRALANSATAIAGLAIYLVASFVADFGRLDTVWASFTSFPPALAISLVFVGALPWLLARRPSMVFPSTMLCLVLLNATIRPEKIGLPVWETENERNVYVRLDAGMEFITKFRFDAIPKFWINARGDTWETLAYPRSFNYCVIQYVLPHLIGPANPAFNAESETFSQGDYLVMAPRNTDELAAALNNLAGRGLTFREIGRDAISYKGLGYLIVVGRLH